MQDHMLARCCSVPIHGEQRGLFEELLSGKRHEKEEKPMRTEKKVVACS